MSDPDLPDIIQILAKGILQLAERSAFEFDYDGDQTVTTGVELDYLLERSLKRLAGISDD